MVINHFTGDITLTRDRDHGVSRHGKSRIRNKLANSDWIRTTHIARWLATSTRIINCTHHRVQRKIETGVRNSCNLCLHTAAVWIPNPHLAYTLLLVSFLDTSRNVKLDVMLLSLGCMYDIRYSLLCEIHSSSRRSKVCRENRRYYFLPVSVAGGCVQCGNRCL